MICLNAPHGNGISLQGKAASGVLCPFSSGLTIDNAGGFGYSRDCK
jgi:hypothetical protein